MAGAVVGGQRPIIAGWRKKAKSLAQNVIRDATVFTGEGQNSAPANPPVETNFISALGGVFPVYSSELPPVTLI